MASNGPVLETLFVEIGVDAKKGLNGAREFIEDAKPILEKGMEEAGKKAGDALGKGLGSTNASGKIAVKSLDAIKRAVVEASKAFEESDRSAGPLVDAMEALEGASRSADVAQQQLIETNPELAEQYGLLSDQIFELRGSFIEMSETGVGSVEALEEVSKASKRMESDLESNIDSVEGLQAALQSDEVKEFAQNVVDFSQKTNTSISESIALMSKFGLMTANQTTLVRQFFEVQAREQEAANRTAAQQGPGGFLGTLLQASPGLRNFVGQAAAAATGIGALQLALVVGASAWKFFNGIVQESIGIAIQATDAQVQLALAVRQQQNEIGAAAGTINEWEEFVKSLSREYGVNVAQTEAVVAQTIRLAQAYGLSRVQLEQLIEAGIKQGEITGQGPGALTTLVYSLQGYARGLRQLGIIITDADKAQAKFQLGITQSGRALTDAQNAAIMLQAILNKTKDSAEEAALADQTLAGSLEEVTNANIEASEAIGQQLVPALGASQRLWGEFLLGIKQVTQSGLSVIIPAIIEAGNRILEFAIVKVPAAIVALKAAAEGLRNYTDRVTFSEQVHKAWTQAIVDGNVELLNYKQLLADTYGDLQRFGVEEDRQAERRSHRPRPPSEPFFPDPQAIQRLGDEVEGTLLKYSDAIEQIVEDSKIGAAKIGSAYSQALERLNKSAAESIAALGESLKKAYAELEKQVAEARSNAIQSAAEQLQDLEEEANEARQDLAEDFQQNQIRSEEDFQIALRRLRDSYLETLEDAVRARDARAVIQAKRQYERQRKDMIDDHGLRRRREQEDQEKRLKDLEENERERREEIEESLQKQLRQIDEQQREQRQMLQESYNEQLRQLQRDLERQRQELRYNYLLQMNDLNNHFGQRMAALGRAFAQERSNVQAHAREIFALLTQYWGVGGQLEGILNAFRERIKTIMDITITYKNPPAVGGGGTPKKQRGGTMIADTATTVTFGEAGAEIATFTPLERPRNLAEMDMFGNMGPLEHTLIIDVRSDGNFSPMFEDALMDRIAMVVEGVAGRGRLQN
jgi:hypothetical protein